MFIGLAPMEGVLDPLLRQVLTKDSQIDCCTTEFVRVTDKLNPQHLFFRYAPELNTSSKTQSGTPVLVQLLGGKPEWMAQNAKRAIDLGAYGIDVNFGCPAKTVNRHDGGAALLKNPERLYNTLVEIKKALPEKTHVSAKVRLGFSDKSLVSEIAHACSDAQATWLTVHARTKEEGYRPPAHWEFIKVMKEISHIPVIANGDIWSLKDYKNCVSISGCEDVMIGRGLLRNPLLAIEIKNNKELPYKERYNKTLQYMRSYAELAAPLYGSQKCLNRMKQWVRMCTQPEQPGYLEMFEKVKVQNDLKSLLTHLH